MDLQRFISSYQGSRVTALVSMSLLVVMIITNVFLVSGLVNKRESVVLIPPNLTQEVKLVQNKANEGYLKAWGLFLAELVGNVTPQNISFIRASVDPLLSPKIYQEFIDALESQAAQIKIDNISMSFEPKVVIFEEESNLVFVSGHSVIAGPAGDETRSTRTYEFMIQMNGYKPLLTWVDTYEGNAKTKKERQRIKKAKDRLIKREKRQTYD